MFRDKMKSMTDEQRNGQFRNIGDPDRRARLQSTYEQGVDSPYVEQGVFAFEKMFREMEAELSARGKTGSSRHVSRSPTSMSFRSWPDWSIWISWTSGFLIGLMCKIGGCGQKRAPVSTSQSLSASPRSSAQA